MKKSQVWKLVRSLGLVSMWLLINPLVSQAESNGINQVNQQPAAQVEGVDQNAATETATPVNATADAIDVYRIYNPNSGEHFYTLNGYEKNQLVELGWWYEGIAFRATATGTPIYRLYNPNSGEHFYTHQAQEQAHLVSQGWQAEGIGWQTVATSDYPVYRVYNPNDRGAGAHHYTMASEERDHLVASGWQAEGVSWYSVTAAVPPPPPVQNFAARFLGTSRARVLNELSAHENDQFYLTTPTQSLTANAQTSMSPKGAPNQFGPRMNCTGFVTTVMARAGGDIGRVTQLANAWGGVANGYNWRDALTKKCPHHVFNSVGELLQSGLAKKGDIIYFEADRSKPNPDCHFGFFWGNDPSHDRFWHSTFPANQLSNTRSGTPFTKIYLFPQD